MHTWHATNFFTLTPSWNNVSINHAKLRQKCANYDTQLAAWLSYFGIVLWTWFGVKVGNREKFVHLCKMNYNIKSRATWFRLTENLKVKRRPRSGCLSNKTGFPTQIFHALPPFLTIVWVYPNATNTQTTLQVASMTWAHVKLNIPCEVDKDVFLSRCNSDLWSVSRLSRPKISWIFLQPISLALFNWLWSC